LRFDIYHRARAKLRGFAVKRYSIVRVGHEYVVQADEKSILTMTSRRRAARLIADAAELMNSQSASNDAVRAGLSRINRA
jgi:hypothetical protein